MGNYLNVKIDSLYIHKKLVELEFPQKKLDLTMARACRGTNTHLHIPTGAIAWENYH